jgi:membrane fusion protein (multidrug efflux system)
VGTGRGRRARRSLAKAEAGVSAASAMLDAEKQRISVLESQGAKPPLPLWSTPQCRTGNSPKSTLTTLWERVAGWMASVGNRHVPGLVLARRAGACPLHRSCSGRQRFWVVANFKETQLEHIRPGQRRSHHGRWLSKRERSLAIAR